MILLCTVMVELNRLVTIIMFCTKNERKNSQVHLSAI